MPGKHLSKREYLGIFRELRRKELSERTDKYYASFISELVMAVYGDNVIKGGLGNELKDFLKRPYGDCSQMEKSVKTDCVLDKIIRDLGAKEAGAGESKFGVNMVSPAAETHAAKNIKKGYLITVWERRRVRLYGEGLPEDGFTGIGQVQDGELYVNGIGMFSGKRKKLKAGQLFDKMGTGERETWRSYILEE